jgi:putative peptidoglycan lipid II flippase
MSSSYGNALPRFLTRTLGRLRLPVMLRRGFPIIIATLISRPLGYARVAIQAWLFGATAAMDAFILAFAVPSFLQVVLLSGPLSSILVPTLSAQRQDRRGLSELFSSLLTACLLVGLVLGMVAGLTAPSLMRLAGPGLAPDVQALAVLLFRLMLPMLVLQAILSVCKGALNTLDSYGPPEYAGVLFNMVMITVALLLTPYMGIASLALGASLGALAQVGMQFPFLHRCGVVYRPTLRFGTHLRQVVRLAQGAFLGTIVVPLASLIDRALASLLFPGAVAALNYAFLLFMLPASLCVVPLSTVLLTDLADLYQQGRIQTVRRQTLRALRIMLLLTVPTALIGAFLATPLTRLVYEYGRFQASDTFLTAQALRIYLLGLPWYGGMHLLSRCFYATHDTMTPALVGLVTLAVNVAGDLLFMQVFSHWGIALARGVALLISAVTLYVLFQRRCARLGAAAAEP